MPLHLTELDVTVSASAPTAPQDGNLWFDTNANTVKVRIAGEWVAFGTPPPGVERLTESGAGRLTESGLPRVLEGV